MSRKPRPKETLRAPNREAREEPSPLTALFARAERTRAEIERLYRSTGIRARGFDDLLRYLSALCDVAAQEPPLLRIGFFARRALADVEAALVAAYHGMLSVTADAMRDMMEMQLLLRHFVHEPDALERWWTAPKSQRKREFQPAHLRKLNVARSGGVASLDEERDYALHSGMLHLTPEPGLRRGVSPDPDMMFEIDLLFAEILWHSVGVVRRYYDLALILNPATASPPLEQAQQFLDAAENAKAFTLTFVTAASEAVANEREVKERSIAEEAHDSRTLQPSNSTEA